MKRRDFLKNIALTGLATALPWKQLSQLSAAPAVSKTPDLIALMGGEPAQMLERAIQELGGISKFVKKGQKVVIKPNIGWDRPIEMGSNTNPEIVAALTRLCLKAGAKEVVVFDHTCDNWQRCYENSGIEKAVKAAGGKIVPGNDESMYKEVALPKGVSLKSAKIHQALLDCDVWFNVPVLKHHGGSKVSISMKNMMGIVWDRRFFHRNDLHQCIADICTYDKKPALNIVDAYRVIKNNGPQGRSAADVSLTKSMFVSRDFVPVDTAATKFFTQLRETNLDDVAFLAKGEALNLGSTKVDKLNVKRIKM